MSSSHIAHGSSSRPRPAQSKSSKSRSRTTKSAKSSKGKRSEPSSSSSQPRSKTTKSSSRAHPSHTRKFKEKVTIVLPILGVHWDHYTSPEEVYNISVRWGATSAAAYAVAIDPKTPKTGTLYNTNLIFHKPVSLTDWRDCSTPEQLEQIMLAQGYSPSKARVRVIETFERWRRKVVDAAEGKKPKNKKKTWLSRIRGWFVRVKRKHNKARS